MQPKLKKCSGCDQLKHIWKRHEKQLYCKDCWSQHPDKGKKPLQAKKPMNKKSSKIQKLDALYTVLRESYLKNNPFCNDIKLKKLIIIIEYNMITTIPNQQSDYNQNVGR